jgi:hypothetical protein
VTIRLESRGGFTGRPVTRELQVDRLPSRDAQAVRRLVDEGGFWTLPDAVASPHPQPWDFDQKLTIEDGGRSRTVRLHASAAPQPLARLLQRLEGLPPAS